MKIILFANTDWYLYNFRISLANKLRLEGYDLLLLSPPGEYGPKLRALGFRWNPVPFSTRSTNPVNNLLLIWRLFCLYRLEKPDLAHHFTIKCVLFGTIAAKMVGGVKIVNAVTGLGHIFTDSGLKVKLIRPFVRTLYRFALKGDSVRVVFQNNDDRNSFVEWGLVQRERTRLIRGSGVDTERFRQALSPDKENEKLNILFASRLLREKGIYELIEAFKRIKSKFPALELLVAGDLYQENPSSLTEQDVEDLKGINGVNVLGHVDDMESLLADSDIVVLPSYREGTPRILIEAAAMEKPIVATDIAGCRGLVEDGRNGFLVPIKSVAELARAIEKLASCSQLRKEFGREGRKIVIEEFDESIVIDKTLSVYKEI